MKFMNANLINRVINKWMYKFDISSAHERKEKYFDVQMVHEN